MSRFFEKDRWLDIVELDNVPTSSGFFPYPALYLPINSATEGINGIKTDGGIISGTWFPGDVQYGVGRWDVTTSGSVNLNESHEYYVRFSSTSDVDPAKGLVCMWYTPEYSYSDSEGGDFTALSQTGRAWRGMAVTSNGNVYACVLDGDIYMQTGGSGDFVALGQDSRDWTGMTTSLSGNVYATDADGGDIYMQTGGSGDFTALSQTGRAWAGMASPPNGNVYACVYGGDIYMQTGGSGDFVALGQDSRDWVGMAVTSNNNVYACVDGGDIYMQTGGVGDFVALDQTSRRWFMMYPTSNDNVYACVLNGDIYMQTGGVGDFVALGQAIRTWYGVVVTPDGNVYATDFDGGDIYINVQRKYLVESYGFLDFYYDYANSKFIGRAFDGTSFLNKIVSGTTTAVVSGTNYHVALGYNKEEGLVLIVDGDLDGIVNTTWTEQTLPAVVSFGCISGTAIMSGTAADGFIDDIRWYKRQITSADLNIIKNVDYSIN